MSIARFSFGLRPLSASDGREGVIVLANIAGLIAQKLKELVSNHYVLSAGRAIMNRTAVPLT